MIELNHRKNKEIEGLMDMVWERTVLLEVELELRERRLAYHPEEFSDRGLAAAGLNSGNHKAELNNMIDGYKEALAVLRGLQQEDDTNGEA